MDCLFSFLPRGELSLIIAGTTGIVTKGLYGCGLSADGIGAMKGSNAGESAEYVFVLWAFSGTLELPFVLVDPSGGIIGATFSGRAPRMFPVALVNLSPVTAYASGKYRLWVCIMRPSLPEKRNCSASPGEVGVFLRESARQLSNSGLEQEWEQEREPEFDFEPKRVWKCAFCKLMMLGLM